VAITLYRDGLSGEALRAQPKIASPIMPMPPLPLAAALSM
jgi:hypothetical protein